MTAQEIIDYVNKRLNCSVERQLTSGREECTEGLKLSPIGEKYIIDRYNKKESEGGFSPYWKDL
jgi:hypothetical protein